MSHLRRIVFPFWAGLFATGLVYGRLLAGYTLYASDMLVYILGQKHLIREALKAGRLPLFDPYTLSGTPLLANITAGALYPANVLLLIGDTLTGYHIFAIAHYLAAYVAMYCFLRCGWRRLPAWPAATGAFAYAAGGFAWSMADHLYFAILPWISLYLHALCRASRAFISGERRIHNHLCMGVFAMAMAFYCGNFQQACDLAIVGAILTLALAFRMFSRNRACILQFYLRTVLTGMFLAAPQLLVTYLRAGVSYREAGLALEEAQRISFPILRIIEYLIPHFFGSQSDWGMILHRCYGGKFPWSLSVFLGIPVLAGFLIRLRPGKRDAWLHLVFIGALFLALGRYTPVYRIVYEMVPGFAMFRHPEKYLLWVHFCVAANGSAGLALAHSKRGRRALRRCLSGLAGIAGCLLIALVALYSYGGENGLYARWMATGGCTWPPERIFFWQLVWASGSLAVCTLLATVLFSQCRLGPLALGCTSIHVLLTTFGVGWCVPTDVVRQTVTAARYIDPDQADLYRLYSDLADHTVPPGSNPADRFVRNILAGYACLDVNTPSAFGLRAMTGFSPVADPLYVEFTDFEKHHPALIMDLCCVRYLILHGLLRSESLPPYHVLISENRNYDFSILENRLALPRIYTTSQYAIAEKGNAVETAFEIAARRRRTGDTAVPPVVLESLPREWHANTPLRQNGNLHLGVDDPGWIDVECDGPTWLVVRDWWSKGWSVEIDGNETAELLKADGAFMSVLVPLGRHRLVFRYSPPGFGPGILLACCAFISLAFCRRPAILEPPGKKQFPAEDDVY